MYDQGKGVVQDYAEAILWYRKAAEQGDVLAQLNLGVMYDEGKGVVEDYVEAIRWFRKAAEQGDARAQYNLGLMYSKRRGVVQDYVQAHMWVNLAASRATGDDQKRFTEARDALARKMNSEQIAEAQRRAREWKPKTGEAPKGRNRQ
jgi:hypothetical protein